jgi:hypothetical protein
MQADHSHEDSDSSEVQSETESLNF